MPYERIHFDHSGSVARIRINRPNVLNALDRPTLEELIAALDQVRDEGRARALILTGEGRAFCAGVDLAAAGLTDRRAGAAPDSGLVLESHFNPLVERLVALPVPIVSAVNGPAAGGGCSLALAGDIVLAARSAYFLQAFVNLGLVPDVGSTWLLPRLIGKARAQAMMMLAERIPAETAESWGMIHRAVDDDVLAAEAEAMAARLSSGPTVAYGLIRQGLRRCLEGSLSDGLALERSNQRAAGLTDDVNEGVRAFLEKRPPRFSGR